MQTPEIQTQLNRIEAKLDVHLEKISKLDVEVTKLETDVHWIHTRQDGMLKIGISLLITAVTGIISILYKKLFT